MIALSPWILKPPSGWALDPFHPQTGKLAAFWSFQEGAGATAADISPAGGAAAGNPLAFGAAAGWAAGPAGQDGQAASLTGATNSFLTTSAAIFDESTTDFSAAAWISLGVTGTTQEVFTHGTVAWLFFTSTNQIRSAIGGATTISSATYGVGSYFVGLALQGTTLTIYVNGSSVASGTVTVAANAGATLRIGATSTGSNRLTGTVSQAAIWTRALAAGEWLALAGRPNDLYLPPPEWSALAPQVAAGGFPTFFDPAMSSFSAMGF